MKKKSKSKGVKKHSITQYESKKIVKTKEERAAMMIYKDYRCTTIFVMEAVVTLIINVCLIIHFNYSLGELPNQFEILAMFFCFSIISFFSMFIMVCDEYPYKENGEVNYEIMRNGETISGIILALLFLIIPVAIFYFSIAIQILCIFFGISFSLIQDRCFGYSKPLSFGLYKILFSSQKILVKANQFGYMTMSRRTTSILLMLTTLFFGGLAIYVLCDLW